MIGLIRPLKRAWVVVLVGTGEGREILCKTVNTIRRDELADVPIFADRTVGRRRDDPPGEQQALS
jgi:hypothetical protein